MAAKNIYLIDTAQLNQENLVICCMVWLIFKTNGNFAMTYLKWVYKLKDDYYLNITRFGVLQTHRTKRSSHKYPHPYNAPPWEEATVKIEYWPQLLNSPGWEPCIPKRLPLPWSGKECLKNVNISCLCVSRIFLLVNFVQPYAVEVRH